MKSLKYYASYQNMTHKVSKCTGKVLPVDLLLVGLLQSFNLCKKEKNAVSSKPNKVKCNKMEYATAKG